MDEETLVSELEELITHHEPTEPLSLSTINLLQNLLDNFQHGPATQSFLSTSSSILPPITLGMDEGSADVSILSSKAYLSLLLASPSYIARFSPVPLLSLLRSLRRSVRPQPGMAGMTQEDPSGRKAKKRNGKRTISSSTTSFIDTGIYLSVVEKLEKVLGLVELARFLDVLKPLIQTVVELPSSACQAFANASEHNRLKKLCSNVLLKVLGFGTDEEAAETAASIFQALTPMVLSNGKSPERTFALGFVKDVMEDNVVGRRDGVRKAVINFPRYLARNVTDKADARNFAVDAIVDLVTTMEVQDQVQFARFSIKMTNGKANLRILGVDLLYNIILSDGKEKMGSDVCKACVDALIYRFSDVNAGVRARALSNMTSLVGYCFSDLFNYSGVSLNVLRKIILNGCLDDKANVRKAAFGFLGKMVGSYGEKILDDTLVKTIGTACSDPLVSIRKAAVQALSEALRNFPVETVVVEWLRSVPRLITDNECSIQEECESLFLELVLNRISNIGTSASLHIESPLTRSSKKRRLTEKENGMTSPESVLALLKWLCDGEVAPWVKKICTNLGKKKKLKKKVTNSLQNIIKASEDHWLRSSNPISKWTAPPGAWFLLSELSAHIPKSVDWEFLHHYWRILDQHKNSPDFDRDHMQGIDGENSLAWASDRVFLLQTISNFSVDLPPDSAADLAHDLLKKIEKFDMHTSEVNAHVKALKNLCTMKSTTPDEADKLVEKWVQQVITQSVKIVESYAKEDSSFTTPVRLRSMSKAETAVYTVGSVVVFCPSADTSRILPLLHTIITSVHSDPKLRKIASPTVLAKHAAPALYTQAWLTMGKLCLSNAKLAKNYLPLFVQELEKSDNAALRNNLVVMMSDFCVRHTSLVDGYISTITKCLRDPCEVVRRQTFILLSRLLQRDYVKWRGVLFLRFLLCLVDESDKIQRLAEFLFQNIVKVKAPLLAYNSFVEAIFVLNDCHFGRSGGDWKAENRRFSLRGNDEVPRSKRMHIYVSLLKQMAPEHLLATFAKLCAEILAAASDNMLNVDDAAGQCVLQDAFRILSCKEFRMNFSRGLPLDGGDTEEDGGASAAKGKAVTQAVRKGVIQNTIPIFIELKRVLESKKSYLIGPLMECLRVLLKDFKNDIDEILVADQQLRKELLYDMQKHEATRARTAAASVRRQGGFSSPDYPPKSMDGVAAALADASAAAKAKSVLREFRNGVSTPPLSALSIPKVRPTAAASASGGRDTQVLESLRRRPFDSDEDV